MIMANLTNKKTVFFGPFIGEFGWELLFWHGWVKRMCRTRYKDFYKIVCSFPGRYPFYPEADEFWSLPDDFLHNQISSRGYITDCWQNGYPTPSVKGNLPDIFSLIQKVIDDFKAKLPEDTIFIHPWAFREDKEDKCFYGVKIKENPQSDKDFISFGIPYSRQVLEKLKATTEGKEIVTKIISPGEKIIAIFPRCRQFRRPDKNWQKENYEILIRKIQKELPDFKIAILGEPGGAFFSDGVPEGCLDLINIDKNSRMDVHLAALAQAKAALGSQSGAITFAMAAGIPVISWGPAAGEKFFSKENFTKSRFVFIPSENPNPETIFNYIKWVAAKSNAPTDNFSRVLKILFYRIFNPRYFSRIKLKMK